MDLTSYLLGKRSGGSKGLKVVVVQELPTTGEENILYLVPKTTTGTNNVFEEYLYINNNWELIGTTDIDLSNYIQKSSTAGLVKNDGTIDTSTYLTQHQDISGKEDKSNKVTSLNNQSTDTQYPSAKCVYDLIKDGNSTTNYLGNISSYNTSAKALNLNNLKPNIVYSLRTSINTTETLYVKVTHDNNTYTSFTSFMGVASEFVYFVLTKEIPTNVSSNIDVGYITYNSPEQNQIKYITITTSGANMSSGTYYVLKTVSTSGEQTITGKKTFSTLPESSVAPTNNTQFTNKKYVDDKPTTYTGYDATKTQILKNVNGTLTWVDE